MPRKFTNSGKAKKNHNKFDKVMSEWGKGSLRVPSGKKVGSQKQALAIAFSEQGTAKKRNKKGK